MVLLIQKPVDVTGSKVTLMLITFEEHKEEKMCVDSSASPYVFFLQNTELQDPDYKGSVR